MDSGETLLTQLCIERLRLMAMMRLHHDSLKGSVMLLAGGMSEGKFAGHPVMTYP